MFKVQSLIIAFSLFVCGHVWAADGDGLKFSFGKGTLILTPLTENAVRIQYVEGSTLQELPDWLYEDRAQSSKVKVQSSASTLQTSKLKVEVDAAAQQLRVLDAQGRVVLSALSHQLRRTVVDGEDAYEATLTTDSPQDEFLFGLGQFQDGQANVRGLSRRLTQVNTQICVPMYLSSRGYGLLWNNYGMTEFNPADKSIALQLLSEKGEEEIVNVTSDQGGREEVRVRNLFRGELDVPVEGDYSLLLDVGQSMASRHNLSIDGQTLCDMQNMWLPPTTSMIVHLTAGRHQVAAELEQSDRPVLYYQRVEDRTVLRSPMANAVDYTVFVGKADEVIAAFRETTGTAPIMPRWALGYVHCRERYHTQEELLSTATRYRREHLPLDLIVQDWQYWGKYGWNAMTFDEETYPDPKLMVDSLHRMNVRLMVSVWSNPATNTEVGREMEQKGYYVPGTAWVDFFNPEAAAFYWRKCCERMLRPYHFDAWWQDAVEPENDGLHGRRVAAGKIAGDWVRNIYPLLVNKTVCEGLRKDDPTCRPMILTRCGFAGMQRYGSTTWSGDVGNSWETLRRQVTAGLGMMAAGQPWWTFDAGGFFRPDDQYTNEDYQKRMLRWIQTSVYLPLMRVHGYTSRTEPWNFSEKTAALMVQSTRERERLVPYIYSNAADIHFNGGTLMRPLVFDFSDDAEALQQKCEYMFGRNLLVSPVTEADVTTWTTYLPKHVPGWYDRFTGTHYQGGQSVTTAVDESRIPVFVKGGSILPVGPVREYASQPTDEPLLLCIYPGADADFTLYDDEGDNVNYQQGLYATIPLHWDDQRQQLTIGRRQGSFEGMPRQQRFSIRLATQPDKEWNVDYKGKKLTVKTK